MVWLLFERYTAPHAHTRTLSLSRTRYSNCITKQLLVCSLSSRPMEDTVLQLGRNVEWFTTSHSLTRSACLLIGMTLGDPKRLSLSSIPFVSSMIPILIIPFVLVFSSAKVDEIFYPVDDLEMEILTKQHEMREEKKRLKEQQK